MSGQRMSDDELHHDPSRARLWAEAKRARVSEARLLTALRAVHRGLDPSVGGVTLSRAEILAITGAAIAEAAGDEP